MGKDSDAELQLEKVESPVTVERAEGKEVELAEPPVPEEKAEAQEVKLAEPPVPEEKAQAQEGEKAEPQAEKAPGVTRVLVIEKQGDVVQHLRQRFEEAPSGSFEVVAVDLLSLGLDELAKGGFDILLLDLMLPDSYGMEAFARVYAVTPTTLPIVVLIKTADKTLAIRAVEKGAEGYLVSQDLPPDLPSVCLKYIEDRKKAQDERGLMEKQIKRAKVELESVVDALGDSVALVDMKQNIIRCNRAMTHFLELSWKKIGGRFFPDLFFSADQIETAVKLFEHMVATLQKQSQEFHLQTRDKWVKLQIAPVYNEDGRISGAIEMVADVTQQRTHEEERKSLEEIIQRDKKDWERTVNYIPDCVMLVDSRQKIVRCNMTTKLFLGQSAENIVGRTFPSVFLEGVPDAGDGPFEDMMRSEKEQMKEYFLASKERWIQVRASPVFTTVGEPTGGIEIVSDITERKKMEAEKEGVTRKIQQAKLEWEATVDAIEDCVVLFDQQQRICRCNLATTKFLKLQWKAILGHNFLETFFPQDNAEVVKLYEEYLHTRKRRAKRILWKERPLFVGFVPLFNKEKLVATVSIIQDIVEAKSQGKGQPA